jgi:prophage regulatory protein
MHTAFSSPSSAPLTPVMPVPDRTQERFLRLPEVMHLCGLSRSTIYDLISRSEFPQQVSLGGKMSPGYIPRSAPGWRTVSPVVTEGCAHDYPDHWRTETHPTPEDAHLLSLALTSVTEGKSASRLQSAFTGIQCGACRPTE